MSLPTALKACCICKKAFTPFTSTATVCSLPCARKVPVRTRQAAKKARSQALAQAKEDRKQTQARLDALRPLSYWVKQAQASFNLYVRLRDADLPCASCDRNASWDGQWHASHFRSTGAAPGLRFNLWNVHKACSICNNHKSGNLIEYEPRLRAKIGAEKVEWLRQQNAPEKRTREYLQRLSRVFRRKANRHARRRDVVER